MKNSFYNIAGGITRIAVSVLTIPLLIRIIGIENYGLWTLVWAFVGVLALAEAGLPAVTTMFVARDLGGDDRVAIGQTLTITTAWIIAIATIVALAVWLGAESAIRLMTRLSEVESQRAIEALKTSALVLWARLVQQNCVGLEQAFQRFGLMNAIVTCQAVTANVGMLLVAKAGGGIGALMKWHAIVSGTTLLAHFAAVYFLLRPLHLRFAWSGERSRSVFKFGLMSWTSSLGSVLFSQADRLVIAAVVSPAVVGVYGAIMNVVAQINTVSALPVHPLLPFISNLQGKERSGEANVAMPVLRHAMQFNALVALGLGAGIFSLASTLATVILGDSVVSGSVVIAFQIAAVIYGVFSVNAAAFYILFGLNELKQLLRIQLACGVASLALIAVGASIWGLYGAIIGNVAYWGVGMLTVKAMRKLQIPWRTWTAWLAPYFAWFLAVILINASLPDNVWLRGALFLLEATALIAWAFRDGIIARLGQKYRPVASS